jgi:hypothetical protein
MKFSEIGQKVIKLAREANQSRAGGRRKPDSPIVTSGGDPSMMTLNLPTREERALSAYLEKLPPAAVYLLAALMYLGRGDFGPKQLPDQYREISETFAGPQYAARQVAEKQPLPEYLEAGFRKLAAAGMDVDSLFEDTAGRSQ